MRGKEEDQLLGRNSWDGVPDASYGIDAKVQSEASEVFESSHNPHTMVAPTKKPAL